MSNSASRFIGIALLLAILQASWWAPELMNCSFDTRILLEQTCTVDGCCATEAEYPIASGSEASDREPCCPGVVCMPFVIGLPIEPVEFSAPDRPVRLLLHGHGTDRMRNFSSSVWRPPDDRNARRTESHLQQQHPRT